MDQLSLLGRLTAITVDDPQLALAFLAYALESDDVILMDIAAIKTIDLSPYGVVASLHMQGLLTWVVHDRIFITALTLTSSTPDSLSRGVAKSTYRCMPCLC